MTDTLNYFDVERGLSIDETIRFITGSGVPGVSGDSTTVPKGSWYADNSSSPAGHYYKEENGAGTDKWKKVATAEDILADFHWRPPAAAHDSVSVTIPTGVVFPTTVDGVTVSDGDRVLFSAITGGGGPNVYIADAGTSTYIEDENEETAGDRLTVLDGTAPNVGVWTYNILGVWVLAEKPTDEKELGYIRQYVGKSTVGDTSGTEPAYSSNNHVTNLDSLVVAIGKLDDQIGAELVAGAYVGAGQDTNDAIMTLDGRVGEAHYTNQLASVTGSQTLDQAPGEVGGHIFWLVRAQDGANVRSWIVSAIHDGNSGAGATDSDREVHSRLKIGTLAADIVGVSLSGTFPTQKIVLTGTSTGTVNWEITRTINPFA